MTARHPGDHRPLTFNYFCESPMHSFVRELGWEVKGCQEGDVPSTECPDTLVVGSCCSQFTSGYRGKCVEGLSEDECGGEFNTGADCWNCYEQADPPPDRLHGGGRCCHSRMSFGPISDGDPPWDYRLNFNCEDTHFTDTAQKCADDVAEYCWPFGHDEEWQQENPFNPLHDDYDCVVESFTPHYRCIGDPVYYTDWPYNATPLVQCDTEQGWCCTEFGNALWTTPTICLRESTHDPYYLYGANGTWVGGLVEPYCGELARCCYPDETGQIIQVWQTPSECARLGGMIRESCGIGACCMGCGRCVDNTLEGECDGLGGQFQGDGSSCGGGCEGAGACCLPDGGCDSPVSVVECTNNGGIFHGNKWGDPPVTCDDVDCPQPPEPPARGACCSSMGLCIADVTLDTCDALNGTFMGEGTVCDPDPC